LITSKKSGHFNKPASFQSSKLAGIIFIILLLFFVVYIIVNPDNGLFQVLSLKKEYEHLESEKLKLQKDNEELKLRLGRIVDADSFIIESEARQKGMVRDGEEVYRLKYIEISDSTLFKKLP